MHSELEFLSEKTNGIKQAIKEQTAVLAIRLGIIFQKNLAFKLKEAHYNTILPSEKL